MKEEKTIFIRCSEETNDLLEAIRKADMPIKSRNSEIIYLIHKEGLSIKEIPIYFKNRIKGQSKLPIIEIFRTFVNLFKLKFF